VVAARPVSALALAALRASGLPRERVLGTAATSASSGLAALIAEELGVAVQDVRAVALGGCGESLVALPRFCSVGGIPATELFSRQDWDSLIERARAGPAPESRVSAAAEIAASWLAGRRRLLPSSVYLDGEYGVHGVFLGVPTVLGAGGLQRIVQLNLRVEERSALQKAAAASRSLGARIGGGV
jgi:malate dehydrogenase